MADSIISLRKKSTTRGNSSETSNLGQIVYSDSWSSELPDRIYEEVFSYLAGKDLLTCRLVCVNWESVITPMITSKCCLAYKGRPKDLIPWIVNKVTNVQRPIKRFLKVCHQNPSLATCWNELRIRDMSAKSSKIFVSAVLSPPRSPDDVNSTLSFTNITKLHVSDSSYRFQRLHSLFSVMPKLESFTDMSTNYLLDWSICCKSFPEIQDNVLQPFQNMHTSIKSLILKRDDSGFKTLFLMKILGFTCDNLESFELVVDTYDLQYPMTFIDRMDYATVVGLMLNMNCETLKEIRFQWVGQLTNHYYDELLRCFGVISWNNTPWNLTKIDIHLDCIFLGNPDFQALVVPFINRLEHLQDLKIKHILLQAEWAQVLDRLRPINYEVTKPNIEFRVMASDNVNLLAGMTPISAVAQLPFLRTAIKSIRVAITSEHTDELKKLIPIADDQEFPGTTELWIQKTEWKPQMRFISYNMEKICETFRNLTILIIADGDKYQYKSDLRGKKQWDKMSNAHIVDEDMQLILKRLRKLVILKLRCRMVYLTDGGTVGISTAAISEMKDKNKLLDIPEPSRNVTGSCFASLADLEEMCLHGLNKDVTDITLYHGFKGLQNLNSLELLGTATFSSQGKKWMKTNFPSCSINFN